MYMCVYIYIYIYTYRYAGIHIWRVHTHVCAHDADKPRQMRACA